jgi:uncharacterized MAPEG superfamily protein
MEILSVEGWVLAWAGLLAAAQLVLMAVPANLQVGTRYLVSPRDEPRALSGVTARLERAFKNHVEGLVLFTVAVVVVTLAEASSPLTEGCAMAYLAARVVYVPLYAFGIPWLRSLAWAVGFLATVTLLGAAVI